MDEDVPRIDVPHDDARWDYPIHDGYMTKQGSFVPSWKKRYMILTLGEMFYFTKKSKKNPKKKKPVLIRGMKFCRTDVRYPKPFYFYAKESSTMLQWLEKLAQAGGIRTEREMQSNKKKVAKDAPEISKKDVSRWSSKNVKEWLGFNSFSNDETFTMYESNLSKFNGKTLETVTESELSQAGVTKVIHRKKLMRAIKGIRGVRKFNYEEHRVYKKIENMTKNMGRSRGTNWKFLAKSLSDPDCMQETYLNPSILSESLDRHIGESDRSGMMDDDSDEEIELVEDDIEMETTDLRKVKPEKFRLPVKLVVTEMVHSDGYKTARRLLSPVISRLPSMKKEFGIFHTAIIVGPWYLEWTDSSLAIPRKLYSGMALVSADIDTTSLLKNTSIDEISEKLAMVVCRWNTTKQYCNMNVGNKPAMGNCQEFVEDVMEELGISLNKDGAFGRYLEEMKKTGQCEMVFQPSKEFKSTFKLQLSKFKFDNHAELDEFVHKCAEVDEIALQMDFKEEYKLLKSFDRAFWLRHFKKPNIEQFRPSRKGCPFDDPRKTKSYMTYT